MNIGILETILLLLVIAVFVTVIFHRIKLPPILGYIFIGILVGPHALGILTDIGEAMPIAEFGIVFLLFTIGLDFSLSRFLKMRRFVFGHGGLQVLFSLIITGLIGTLFGMSLSEVFIISGVVAMSSTAIVLKQLKDQNEINTPHGEASLGILLFQDLAVIPLLILIPSLVDISGYDFTVNLFFAAIKGILAVLFILLLGRWVLRPLFHAIVKTKSLELFTLAVLLVTLGASWITNQLGLSLALGAFVAGMMLSETEFRKQIEDDIRPFRDVLLGLFFISIGMQLNLEMIIEAWQWVLLLLAALILFKTALIAVLGMIFGADKKVAWRTGLNLAQGGEFGFAILSLALSYKLLPVDYGQVILGAILLSMAIAPLMIRYGAKITNSHNPDTASKT